MTWFKVDDSFYDHPKAFDASDAAVALWTRAGCWSARNLTDGFVPDGMLGRLSASAKAAAEELSNRGLWRRTRGGYRFHDWTEYQPTRERIEHERKLAAQRQANFRDRKQNRTPDPVSSRRDRPVSNAVSNGASHASPTRPDPTIKGGTGSSSTDDRARGNPEPPTKCPQHLNDPNPPPCGNCAEHRRTNDRWHANRNTRLRYAPQCPKHRGELAHNCRLCRAEQLAPIEEAP